MALAKKAKQPVRGAAAVKPAKITAKVVKDGKKAAPAKNSATVKVVAKAPAKIASVKLKEKPQGKSAAEQPKAQAIGAAKAALKRQNTEKQPVASADTVAAARPAKAKAKSRKFSIDINPSEAASALAQKWGTLYKKAEQIDAKPYNMKAVFEEKTAIVHKVLGWGYILANRNDRLEVLFKDGIKYLISNYKP